MIKQQQRRHSKWYEKLLFSSFIQLILGIIVVSIVPTFYNWSGLWQFNQTFDSVQLHTTLGNTIAFIIAFNFYKKFQKFPSAHSAVYLLSVVAMSWLAVISYILFLRLDYSRPTLIYSFLCANVWMLLGYYLGRKYHQLKLAVVPLGDYELIEQFTQVDCRVLVEPSFANVRYDAVVADLSAEMSNEWQIFLTNCALANIPVYHSRLMIEQLSGRVKVNSLSENIFGALHTTTSYSIIKRILEIILVIVLMPIWVPVMLIFGVIIKLESDGPMFFIQERVGLGDKDFKVYKLRSMGKDSESKGAQFASADDIRVTRVGKFIRKTRIDEIPQFINILKGDMSLIGPRPEQRVFVEKFKQEIPFYSYRHVVRPGISGWAQVTQGYAANADETSIKLEYDLYYIKYFSFWLDVLIVLKTIKTMLTGFGAR